MGFDPLSIRYIRLAHEHGLGCRRCAPDRTGGRRCLQRELALQDWPQLAQFSGVAVVVWTDARSAKVALSHAVGRGANLRFRNRAGLSLLAVEVSPRLPPSGAPTRRGVSSSRNISVAVISNTTERPRRQSTRRHRNSSKIALKNSYDPHLSKRLERSAQFVLPRWNNSGSCRMAGTSRVEVKRSGGNSGVITHRRPHRSADRCGGHGLSGHRFSCGRRGAIFRCPSYCANPLAHTAQCRLRDCCFA